MLTAQIGSILENLRAGVIEASDLERLEELGSQQVLEELACQYPVRFLESRGPEKWEFGQAQSRRRNLYRHCLLLTSEQGRLTTLAMLTFLRIRPPGKPTGTYEFTSGGGFSLYRDPDGWKLKLLEERKTTLTKKLMERRGWRLV